MHKQRLPEEDECTQASHYNITSLGVVNVMGKMYCAPTKPATEDKCTQISPAPLTLWPRTWLHRTQLKAPAAQNPLIGGLMTRRQKNAD